ncbi:nitroreductase family protein [Alkaliphilus crotonatoxidans]
MKEIFERRSIRKYTNEEVSAEKVRELLRAAMAAPSAGNGQPWEFVVVRDKGCFNQIMEVHPYSKMLKDASVAIVVCGDTEKEKYGGYWVQDCAAATQNILLMAQHLGLGAVWLGVHPTEDRVKAVQKILSLPEAVIPLSIISIGYPAEERKPENRYDQSKIHYEKW